MTPFADLVAGCDERTLAAFLQVSLLTFRRWKSGTTQPPYSAIAALQFKLDGKLCAVHGKGWEGCSIGSDGLFYAPYFQRGINAHQLQGLYYMAMEAKALRAEVRQLRAALTARNATEPRLRRVK
jgi:hypothetical protein